MLPVATNIMNPEIIKIIFNLKLACLAKEESILEELKISPSEYRGLTSIQPGEIVSCMQLSGDMGLSKSRGSRVIDKLIENGYLKEAKNGSDKRVFNVTLSLKGINAVKKINRLMGECESAILKNVPKDELSTFIKTLNKISNILSV
jgi:MarR family transcriptional regulator, organic hydroperoxide resistance regulator